MASEELTAKQIEEVTACLVKKELLPEGSKFTRGYRSYFSLNDSGYIGQEVSGVLQDSSSRPLLAPREAYAYPKRTFDATLRERRRGDTDLVEPQVTDITSLVVTQPTNEFGVRRIDRVDISVVEHANTGDPVKDKKKAAEAVACFSIPIF